MIPIEQDGIFINELQEKIKEIIQEDNIELNDQRIIVTIDANGVKTKIVTPLSKKQKKTRIEPRIAKRIEEAKKILKGRRDLIYIVTLLISLSNELKKISTIELPIEHKQLLLSAADEVRNNLTNLTKGVVHESSEG